MIKNYGKNHIVYNTFTQKIKRDSAGICYFYPADLPLVPYPENKAPITAAEGPYSGMQKANLRLRLDNQAWYQFIPCMYNERKGILYISEEQFNLYWREIRYKLLGHYIAKKNMRTITKEELDQQVILEKFCSETQDAKIIDARIVVFTRLPVNAAAADIESVKCVDGGDIENTDSLLKQNQEKTSDLKAWWQCLKINCQKWKTWWSMGK